MHRFRVVLALLLATMAGTARAGDDSAEPELAIAYRQSVFKMMYWNFSRMGAMVRGAQAFDRADFAKRAERIAFLANQIEEGFPKGSHTGALTEAKPAIWENWDDFTTKLGALRRESATLRDIAGGEDEDATRAQFMNVREACAACHEAYKAD